MQDERHHDGDTDELLRRALLDEAATGPFAASAALKLRTSE